MTSAEKRRNWWDYHKRHVLIAILVIAAAIWMISDVVSNKLNTPDYQIAYVGSQVLPDSTVAELEQAFASFATDVTGNGEVQILVRQYILGNENSMDYTMETTLMLDLTTGESLVFIMEDPESIQQMYGPFAYADGVYGDEEARNEPLWYRWGDCPALTALDLGNYLDAYEDVEIDRAEGDNQKILADFFIGRRGSREEDQAETDNAFWANIIAGAR